jgi:hypothetical protein
MGKLVTICSRTYFLSSETVKKLYYFVIGFAKCAYQTQANYNTARDKCCAMGMTLSILETRVEEDCIINYNKSKRE